MLKLPELFENRMKKLLAEEWEDFYSCYANDRYQALRINPLKVSAEEYGKVLQKATGQPSPEAVPWAVNGYYYGDEARPGKHPYHEMGLYYIQEPSAMSAAALLAPEPGMRVLDLCAAPGGKTTQLASYLMGEGLLVANEINNARARILSSNVERMGIPNCMVTNEDSGSLAEHFPAYFHAILVDAPCSGEGMFRKNPEAIDEWSPENVRLCASRQEEILDNAARMLLPGGSLVYSTCTFAPEENEQSIAAFLERHPEFHVKKVDAPCFSPARPEWAPGFEKAEATADTMRLWPHKLHGEGHYAAMLVKDGLLPDYKPACRISDQKSKKEREKEDKYKRDRKNKKGGKDRKDKDRSRGMDAASLQLFEAFLAKSLQPELAERIRSGKLELFGSQLYLLPDQVPPLRGLHVLRAGLHIGEFLKNRFEPSHSLALAMSAKDAIISADFALEDVRSYAFFRGEGFALEENDFADGSLPAGGWCLVCVDGKSAGWGKIANQTLKNHYPKGLRTDLTIKPL